MYTGFFDASCRLADVQQTNINTSGESQNIQVLARGNWNFATFTYVEILNQSQNF
jgi:hypothetical protein